MEWMELFNRRQIYSVSRLMAQYKNITEDHFNFIWVEGEVAGLRRPASGHCYFSLKDDHASLRAVMFRQQAMLLRFALEEGSHILCRGRLSIYEPRGDVQFMVETAEPVGLGAMALALQQLRKRLEQEGLFYPDRKKKLPSLPRRVAVLTSPSGAAIHDFLNVLHRRFKGITVGIYPVSVQGPQAPAQMIEGLKALTASNWPDVIVLTRGGGSPEDLWAYNDEALVRAIAASPIPVVSAVGHEIDVTLSDLAADLRAPTPSAAAELLADADLAKQWQSLKQRLTALASRIAKPRRAKLEALCASVTDPRRHLANRRLLVDDLLLKAIHALKLRLHETGRQVWQQRNLLYKARPDHRLSRISEQNRELNLRARSAILLLLKARRARLDELNGRLGALSPLSVLSRGYALVLDEAGHIIRSRKQVSAGQKLTIRLNKEQLEVTVNKT